MFIILYISMFLPQAQASNRDADYMLACEANTIMVINQVMPEFRTRGNEARQYAKETCEMTKARLSKEDWALGAEVAGCIDGVQLGVANLDLADKKILTSNLMKAYCKR